MNDCPTSSISRLDHETYEAYKLAIAMLPTNVGPTGPHVFETLKRKHKPECFDDAEDWSDVSSMLSPSYMDTDEIDECLASLKKTQVGEDFQSDDSEFSDSGEEDDGPDLGRPEMDEDEEDIEGLQDGYDEEGNYWRVIIPMMDLEAGNEGEQEEVALVNQGPKRVIIPKMGKKAAPAGQLEGVTVVTRQSKRLKAKGGMSHE